MSSSLATLEILVGKIKTVQTFDANIRKIPKSTEVHRDEFTKELGSKETA